MCKSKKPQESNDSTLAELKVKEVRWSIRRHKTAVFVSLATMGGPLLTLLYQHWPW